MYIYNTQDYLIPLDKITAYAKIDKALTTEVPISLAPKDITLVYDSPELYTSLQSGQLSVLVKKGYIKVTSNEQEALLFKYKFEAHKQDEVVEEVIQDIVKQEYKSDETNNNSDLTDKKLDLLIGAVTQLAEVIKQTNTKPVVKGKRGRPKGSKNVKNN